MNEKQKYRQIRLKDEPLTIPSCFHCPILVDCMGSTYCQLEDNRRIDNWNIIQEWCRLEDDKSYLRDTDKWEIKYGSER